MIRNAVETYTVVCISGETVLDLNRTHVYRITKNLIIKLKTLGLLVSLIYASVIHERNIVNLLFKVTGGYILH